MSPKRRFNMMLEPKQIEILREIERRTGATVSEQVRRAIDAYLRTQNVITEKEIRQILKR
ncbi:MAG: ribbon-helix-helix domain-containing protein [Vicinamibacteraceae bacterium]